MFDYDLPSLLTDPELESLTAAGLAAWDETESDRQLIPADLDEWIPGPHLSAVLSSIDSSRLNGHDAVIVMRAWAHQVSHDQAGYYRSIREVATAVPTDENGPPFRSEQWFEYTNLELRAALTLTNSTASARNSGGYFDGRPIRASFLQGFHPRIGCPHNRVNSNHLDDHTARIVVDRVLVSASGLTTGQLRARIRRLCIETNPEDARQRVENAVEDRRMVIADIARQVAKTQADSHWRTTVTDKYGNIVHTGTTRRRPTTSQKRQIHAQYPTCVFLGCRMPAAQCDIDHRTPWSEVGETSVENNAPPCAGTTTSAVTKQDGPT